MSVERKDMTAAWDCIVIGAGAAGLLAACVAAENGRQTVLLEKNTKAGVKILISGGTRCNITHAVEKQGIIEAYGPQGPFLHSALSTLTPSQLVALFEDEGVKTKTEEGGKIFPASDRALDVQRALLGRLQRSGAQLRLTQHVLSVAPTDTGFAVKTNDDDYSCESVLITTGGKSFPGCGTTGEGYHWLEQLGHSIVSPRPALVPITSNAEWVTNLQGLTLPKVRLHVETEDGEVIRTTGNAKGRARSNFRDSAVGSLLFTHFGLSGPVALDLSRVITLHTNRRKLFVVCDFLPDLDTEAFDQQLKEQCERGGKKQLPAILHQWFLRRQADVIMLLADVPADRRGAELNKSERERIVRWTKRAAIPITGTLGFEKAEVTTGGVALAEVNSKTMESKLVPGLFLAGEILDLDGPIGGYNFQAAFSTGYLAGLNL